MSDQLVIDFKWMGRPENGAFDQAFAAEIGVRLGNEWLTELEELASKTTATHLRACAHTLAQWLAGNWWRLRWEPEVKDARTNTDWRIAHSMANAGGGFTWPNILFASDGESIAIASSPRLHAAAHEPLRYLNAAHGRIGAPEFEQKIDAFIAAVVTRNDSFSVNDDKLPRLWAEVLDERQTPEIARWRRLEALCGYDPDEAPEPVIASLTQDEYGLGPTALEEVAAFGRHDTAAVLKSIARLSNRATGNKHGSFPCSPTILNKPPSMSADLRPWVKGTQLAKAARAEWGLGKRAVSDRQLGDLIKVPAKAFEDRAEKAETPIPLAIREDDQKARLYFNSSWRTSRRFAASRLLGHWLDKQGHTERLIPVTDAKTANQQFQRAFAQEFLCPIETLRDRFERDAPTSDEIHDTANDFGVSPLMIQTTLVNNGEMERESLGWAVMPKTHARCS